MATWTRLENIALYLIIEEFEKDVINEAITKRHIRLSEIAKERFSEILAKRTIDGIKAHIDQLKQREGELNIPDPRHNNDRGFNKY